MKTQLFKLSLSLFVIYSLTSCNDEKPVEVNKVNVEETKRLEEERKRIEEEKLAMDAEKKAMEETKEKDRLVAIEKLEKKFQNVSGVLVIVSKSYFHDAPDFSTKRKAYLVKYDIANLLRTRNGFGFVEYNNYEGEKTTSGWISLTDLAEEGAAHGY
jgi:hypothetical protein